MGVGTAVLVHLQPECSLEQAMCLVPFPHLEATCAHLRMVPAIFSSFGSFPSYVLWDIFHVRLEEEQNIL